MNYEKTAVLAALAALVTGVLFINPVGLMTVGVFSTLVLLNFPSLPWFAPAAMLWMALYGTLSISGWFILKRITKGK